MCKIFMVAGIKPSTSKKVWEFAERIAKPMSYINKDGLGYAALTKDGNMFVERWLTNYDAFKTKSKVKDETEAVYQGAVEKTAGTSTGEYNNIGIVDRENTVAITMHTRMATSPRGLMNTHPFVEDGVSLIHNGVIKNDREFTLKSTCDSEAILRAYIDAKVWEDPKQFQDAASRLRGYYACGVLYNSDAGPTMEIFKAYMAMLYVCYVNELETWVHCTSDDNIKEICRDMGFTHGPVYKILEGKHIKIDGVSGKTISITPFTPGKEWEYSGGYGGHHYSENFQNTEKKTGSTSSGNLPAVSSSTVVPWNKRKKGTEISAEMMTYFKNKSECVQLSDLQVQQEIMDIEAKRV